MAEEGNIGTALAEGTNASGYRGSPITNAIQFSIQNELKKQAKEAEREAERNKLLEKAQKFKTIKSSPLHPMLQSGASKFGEQVQNSMIGSMGDKQALSELEFAFDNFKNEALGIDQQIKADAQKASSYGYVMNPKLRGSLGAYTKEQARAIADSYDDIDRIIDFGNTVEQNLIS